MSKEELLEVAKPYLEKQNTVWVSQDGRCFVDHQDALHYQSVMGAFIHEFKKEHVLDQKDIDFKKNKK